LQGGLSRNKVAVGESAAGSPPKHKKTCLTNQMPINRNKILKPLITEFFICFKKQINKRITFQTHFILFGAPEKEIFGEGRIACFDKQVT
jgi:hypothetical protein